MSGSPSQPKLICHTDRRPWPCELAADWTLHLPELAQRGSYHFATERPGLFCTHWFTLENDGTLTLLSGYATDGCTLAPDFAAALPACILHDALRQALRIDPTHCPWTRREADQLFLRRMKFDNFPFVMRWLYYLAVSSFVGRIYSSLADRLSPPQDRLCLIPFRSKS